MKNVLIICISAVLILSSCGKDEVVCDGSTPTYEASIKTIIDANCLDCHSEYNDYAGVKTDVDNGSFEKEVISQRTMPRGGDLSASELSKIKCWLEQGSPEN